MKKWLYYNTNGVFFPFFEPSRTTGKHMILFHTKTLIFDANLKQLTKISFNFLIIHLNIMQRKSVFICWRWSQFQMKNYIVFVRNLIRLQNHCSLVIIFLPFFRIWQRKKNIYLNMNININILMKFYYAASGVLTAGFFKMSIFMCIVLVYTKQIDKNLITV